MSRLKVLVLFGGISSESDQSLQSAAAVLQSMPEEKYECVPVGINRKGRWFYFPGDYDEISRGTWAENPDCIPAILSPDSAHHGILILEDTTFSRKRIDVVFSLLRGKCGEGGAIQGLCELSHIPYVGNGITGSAICRNKAVTHALLNSAGISTPRWIAVPQREMNRLDRVCNQVAESFQYPVYVKPACSGYSVASGVADSPSTLTRLIKHAFTQGSTVMVEEYVEGRELRIGVFGYELPFTSFAGEILGPDKQLTVPATLQDSEARKIREIAIQAFCLLECQEFALIDFFLKPDGTLLLEEVNTMPAMAEQDIYPVLMADLGMRYPYLLEKMVEQAIEHVDH